MLEIWSELRPVQLKNEEIHLWCFQDKGQAVRQRFYADLSVEARKQHAAFRTETRQREFLIGQGFCQQVLSQYLGRPPAAIHLVRSPSERPYVADAPYDFNLSHSHGGYALVVGQGLAVGVDIEFLKRQVETEMLASVFAPNELAQLAACEGERRRAHFFRLWTLKEAVWKALGMERAYPFTHFAFHFEPARVVGISETFPSREWCFFTQPFLDTYLISIATASEIPTPVRLRSFQFSPPASFWR